MLTIKTNIIEEKWKEYITTVSEQGHASSLELCTYMYNYLVKHKPTYVVDMGSGLSSFVTRYYKQIHNPDAVVYSVDDDSSWINKTRDYLIKEELSVENLILFEDFKNTDLKFDYILYDLGHIPTRIANIKFPATIAKSGSVILYDDIHFDRAYSNRCGIFNEPYLQDVFYEYINEMNFNSEKLIETVDVYGRYCMKVDIK